MKELNEKRVKGLREKLPCGGNRNRERKKRVVKGFPFDRILSVSLARDVVPISSYRFRIVSMR